MKKILLIVCLALCFKGKAQAFLGESRDSVVYFLDATRQGYTVDTNNYGQPFIKNNVDDEIRQCWYFDEEGRCINYVLLHPIRDKALVLSLLSSRYRREGDKWYDEKQKVQWTYEEKGEFMVVIAKRYQ
jgi:hypothetical protein